MCSVNHCTKQGIWQHLIAPAALVSGQRENKHSRISLAYLGASVDA